MGVMMSQERYFVKFERDFCRWAKRHVDLNMLRFLTYCPKTHRFSMLSGAAYYGLYFRSWQDDLPTKTQVGSYVPDISNVCRGIIKPLVEGESSNLEPIICGMLNSFMFSYGVDPDMRSRTLSCFGRGLDCQVTGVPKGFCKPFYARVSKP